VQQLQQPIINKAKNKRN